MSGDMPNIRLQSIPCPLCGAEQSEVRLQCEDLHAGIPGRFTIARCLTCRHLFMNPRPVDQDLLVCYPTSYGPHQTVVQTPVVQQPVMTQPQSEAVASSQAESPAKPQSPVKPWYLRCFPLGRIPGLKAFYTWLIDDRSQPVLATRGSGQAFELGCATGLYLQKLRDAGWSVKGVEPGTSASEKARNAGFDVATGTLDTVSIDQATYDLAAAWMVLEHVTDPRKTLQQLRGLLKPGGTLMLSIPNAGCWESFMFRSWWFGWEPPRHLQHFTPASIRRVLTESGFSDIQVIHQSNLSYVVGSTGLFLRNWFPGSRIAEAMIAYPAHPTTIGKLLLAMPAKFLSLIGQSGRLTIIAHASALS